MADLASFEDAGYTVAGRVVLTRRRAFNHRRGPTRRTAVRPLAGDDDWAQRVSLDLVCDDGGGDGFSEFTRIKAAAERRLTETGDGVWYGAFDNGRLVATMGVVRAGSQVARFQEVQTHPEARGRGVGGSLVHAAGADALRRLGLDHARHGDRTPTPPRSASTDRSGSPAPSSSSRRTRNLA